MTSSAFTTSLTNELLLRALEPLEKYYNDPTMEEIAINRPGEICFKKMRDQWRPTPVDEVTYKGIVALCRMLANVTDQTFDMNSVPILAATLPGGHRFQAVVGANVRYEMGDTSGIALNIRRFDKDRKFKLDDFSLRSGEQTIEEAADNKHKEEKKRYSGFAYEDLVGAVEQGEAVLISGATSTGKTTFLNALVEFIPKDRRIITVEDTREVSVPHINRVHFVVSRTEGSNAVGYAHILDSVVRMTPDVIVCGEISITNSKGIYRLMTTGHANFMATIHADSPEMALRAFWQNLSQASPELDADAAVDILSRSFGRIVQIDRHDGTRKISAVEAPNLIKKVMHEQMKKDKPTVQVPDSMPVAESPEELMPTPHDAPVQAQDIATAPTQPTETPSGQTPQAGSLMERLKK